MHGWANPRHDGKHAHMLPHTHLALALIALQLLLVGLEAVQGRLTHVGILVNLSEAMLASVLEVRGAGISQRSVQAKVGHSLQRNTHAIVFDLRSSSNNLM